MIPRFLCGEPNGRNYILYNLICIPASKNWKILTFVKSSEAKAKIIQIIKQNKNGRQNFIRSTTHHCRHRPDQHRHYRSHRHRCHRHRRHPRRRRHLREAVPPLHRRERTHRCHRPPLRHPHPLRHSRSPARQWGDLYQHRRLNPRHRRHLLPDHHPPNRKR